MSEEIERLQREYLSEIRRRIGEVRANAQRLRLDQQFKNAFPSLLFAAHQLKGSGGALGFPRISNVGQQMTETLTLFLDETGASRPTPAQLSDSLLELSRQLEDELARCEA
ncbi:MAG TPA: Hpt domain-containing protein [Thermoanaerobaculia bacterium]|nr:Hpt domain-containing protein [Thermoanaerobaculia bacterium]